jgi:hypothetical protein
MENSFQVEQIKYNDDFRNSGILKGIPSSNGIVIAKAYVLENFKGIITDDNLENIDVNSIKNSVYHLKIALLKVSYLAYRKGSYYNYKKLKELIDQAVKKFLEDLEKIANSEEDLKKKMLEKSKKVFKDFLNAIIIKSYYPDQNDRSNFQKNIQNQGFNRASYWRR